MEIKKRFSIYLLANGRLNLANLSVDNLDYVSDALRKVVSYEKN
jgi:aspartate/tyrosine/aromatic aminotransferase